MMESHPLLVGITGGIGSGKSLVSKIFSCLGAPVYDADNRAKWLMNNDDDLKKKIILKFGDKSFTAEGTLNREYLANTVFKDEGKLKQLNALVHPAVGEDFKKWATENRSSPYLIKEAALIFESGSYKILDVVVTITAPADIRIERILSRDPFRSREQVEHIMQRQLSDEERKELADYELINDNEHLIIPQVLKLHQKFIGSVHTTNPAV